MSHKTVHHGVCTVYKPADAIPMVRPPLPIRGIPWKPSFHVIISLAQPLIRLHMTHHDRSAYMHLTHHDRSAYMHLIQHDRCAWYNLQSSTFLYI